MRVRWAIRRDMEEIVAIAMSANASRHHGDTATEVEEAFLKEMRQRNRVGMVAELEDGTVGGFVIYLLQKGRMELLALEHRHDQPNAEEAILNRLIEKLSRQRPEILVTVPFGDAVQRRTCLRRMQLLKELGFAAEGTTEDAVQFRLIHEIPMISVLIED